MNMREAGRIGNDSIRNERSPSWTMTIAVSIFSDFVRVGARSPAALKNLCHALLPPPHVACSQGFYPRNQAWVLDHKGHQFGRIAANVEKFQTVLLDELLECAVSGEADAMAILSPEDLAQRNERLNIASGPNDLDDDVEWWRWSKWSACSFVHKRRWWLTGLFLFLYAVQIQVDLLQLIRQFRTRSGDVDIDPSVIWSIVT
jgi:hypothetical protein